MSYDLFFYTRKGDGLTTEKIVNYLSKNLVSEEGQTEWLVEDEETETYYSIVYEETIDSEDTDNEFEGFENTGFAFNLNYFRPDFFGQEAFPFIDKMITDLGLYVVNPQADYLPYIPEKGGLYKNWSEINEQNIKNSFTKFNLVYLPLETSNYIYSYRKNRAALWRELGEDDYYVSKLYTDITKKENTVITIANLPFETAVLVPKVDYFYITKRYKKWFREVEEMGLVSYDNAMKAFGHLFENYAFPDCKLLPLRNVKEAQAIYNKTPFDHKLEDYAYRAEVQKLANVKP